MKILLWGSNTTNDTAIKRDTLFLYFSLVTESPIYTASKGDKETTIVTLKKSRNNKSPEEIEQDHTQIEVTLKSRATANAGLKSIFETRATRRGFIIGAGCMFTAQLSGGGIIMSFIGPIFNNAGTSMSGNTVPIYLGSVKQFFFLITFIIVGRLGRRPMLLFSSFGACVSHTILAVYFYLKSTNSPIVEDIDWLPISCVLGYISAYSLGMGSIPIGVETNFLMFVHGSIIVWTSPVIPQLQSPDSEINPLGEKITTPQVSLLVGLPLLFNIMGPLFFGTLPDIIGRKYTLLCMSLGILLANTAVAFATHIYVYYAGRSIIFLCLGLMLVVLPIYLNEICEDYNRAKHGCLMMFFSPLGSLYGYLVGPITNVKVFTLLCTAPLIPQVIFLCLLLPESPLYTASKGDKDATFEILKKLRSDKSAEEIEADFIRIELTLKGRVKPKVGSFKKLLETQALRKGFIIGLGMNLGTHVSGIAVIMAFLGPIFNDAGTSMSGNDIAILVGTVKLLFFFVTITIVEKLGRRPLLLFSSAGTAISLAILAVYFYLNRTKSPLIDNIRWLPIVCILLFIATFSLGLGSIPLPILSEFFPNDLRSVATSLSITLVNIFIFVMTSAFPFMSEMLGVHYCIGIFSVGCFLNFIFIYFLLPETRGKSFLEIQGILSG